MTQAIYYHALPLQQLDMHNDKPPTHKTRLTRKGRRAVRASSTFSAWQTARQATEGGLAPPAQGNHQAAWCPLVVRMVCIRSETRGGVGLHWSKSRGESNPGCRTMQLQGCPAVTGEDLWL